MTGAQAWATDLDPVDRAMAALREAWADIGWAIQHAETCPLANHTTCREVAHA